MTELSSDYCNLEVMAEAQRYNAFLAAAVGSVAGAARRVLDFGAGVGTFADTMRAAGYDVACVETEPALQAILRNRGFELEAAVEQLQPASFDFAYTLNVLEHIEDDVAALRGVAAALKPNARLFIYVPAFMALFTSMDRRVGHLRRYRRADLVRRVRSAGFTVERAEYVDSLGFPATLLYRLIGHPDGTINLPLLRLYDTYMFPLSRAFDRLTSRLFGKNLLLVATKSG